MRKLLGKKSYVTATDKARSEIAEAVSAFATLSSGLQVASATLVDEALTNRDIAASLLEEAATLEAEAEAGSKLAGNLASLTA